MDEYQVNSILILVIFYSVNLIKLLIQKQKGIETIHVTKGKKSANLIYVEFVMKVAVIGVPIYELVSVMWNINKASESVRAGGLVLAYIGLGIFCAAAYCMHDSWMIGIPIQKKTKLITEGIYSVSRNPAFVGYFLTYLGILFMFFNIPLLLFTVFGMIMLHIQVLLEEKYLTKMHGKIYRRYKKMVCRYIGRHWKYKKV